MVGCGWGRGGGCWVGGGRGTEGVRGNGGGEWVGGEDA